MEFLTIDFDFPPQSGVQLRSVSLRQAFSATITKAAVCVTGYTFHLQGDREVKNVVVRLESEIYNSTTTGDPEVRVVATLGIRDSSGYYDDPFSGKISALLMYELAPRPDGGPPDGRIDRPVWEVLR